MPNKKISQLPASPALTGAEEIPLSTGGVTYKVTAAAIAAQNDAALIAAAAAASAAQSTADAHALRNDNPHTVTTSQIGAIPDGEKGNPGGVATLDGSGLVPVAQLPVGSGASQVAAGDDPRFADARTALAHAASHKTGGSDAIKLDELAAPDDNTNLNATTSAHGLLPKLSGVATEFLNGQGVFAPAGGALSAWWAKIALAAPVDIPNASVGPGGGTTLTPNRMHIVGTSADATLRVPHAAADGDVVGIYVTNILGGVTLQVVPETGLDSVQPLGEGFLHAGGCVLLVRRTDAGIRYWEPLSRATVPFGYSEFNSVSGQTYNNVNTNLDYEVDVTNRAVSRLGPGQWRFLSSGVFHIGATCEFASGVGSTTSYVMRVLLDGVEVFNGGTPAGGALRTSVSGALRTGAGQLLSLRLTLGLGAVRSTNGVANRLSIQRLGDT